MKKRHVILAVCASLFVLLILGGCTQQPPIVSIGTDKTTGHAPLAVKFTGIADCADSWAWSFGDGGTSTEQSPIHVYQNVGPYIATLTVTVNSWCGPVSTSQTVDITVTETPVIKINSIEVSSGPYCTSTPIRFTINAESNYPITQYTIDSNNSNPVNAQSTSISFGQPGIKTITATVTNSEGVSATTNRQIYVEDCCDDPCDNGCDNPCDEPDPCVDCDIDFPCGWDNIQAKIDAEFDGYLDDREWYEFCVDTERAPCSPCDIVPSGIAPQGIVPSLCNWDVQWSIKISCEQGCGTGWKTPNSEDYEFQILGDDDELLKARFFRPGQYQIGAQLYYNGEPVGQPDYVYRWVRK